MEIIDIHCHTTNRLLSNSAQTDASIPAIEQLMSEYGISHTIVLSTYFPDKGTGISNFRLYNWIRNHKSFSMFGSLDFEYYFYQGLNELYELAENKTLKGVKLYTAYQEIDFTSEKFKEVIQLLRKYKLPLMFHGGVSYNLWKKLGILEIRKLPFSRSERPEDFKSPEDIALLAEKHPDINIIVSHLCKPFFTSMINVLKKYSNIYTDISGIIDSKQDSNYVEDCVETVKQFAGEAGTHKIMFGTDFPVQSHAHSLYIAQKALENYQATEKEQFYSGNAKRIIFSGIE